MVSRVHERVLPPQLRSFLLVAIAAVVWQTTTTIQHVHAELESFGTYQPSTDVSDHAAIALDQSELEYAITELRRSFSSNDDDDDDDTAAAATYDDLLTAMLGVYRNGGNSRPYAVLTLQQQEDDDNVVLGTSSFGQGTPVVLVSPEQDNDDDDDDETALVYGELLTTAAAATATTGTTTPTRLHVLYTADTPEHACRVGFLPRPSLDYCFPATGTIRIGATQSDDDDDDNDNYDDSYDDDDDTSNNYYYYDYAYSPSEDNLSDRTIQRFSTDQQIHHVLGQASNPLHESMATFQDYYGVVDYADRIVQAALTKSNSGFSKRGNLDFTNVDEDDLAGAEAAMKGTVVLHMFMMVLRELEHSLDLCAAVLNGDDDRNYTIEDDPVRALDKAVAYYMGSLEGNVADNSTDSSHMLYYVADSICADFRTCEGGESRVNGDIFLDFDLLQDIYNKVEDCSVAESIIRGGLIHQLYVPLIQSTLFYAFQQDIAEQSSSARTNAEGAMFTASILPIVHACDAEDAEIIYQNMKLDETTSPDFFAVKHALERNYECMGVTCFDIGGAFIDGEFFPGAEPCSDEPEDSSASGTEVSPVVSAYEPLGSYTPSTNVADYAAIALDQAEMERAVQEKEDGIPDTYDHLLQALLAVYRNGGNSRPYARLTLDEPLETTILQGTSVSLVAEGENPVHGELLVTAQADSTRIDVLYKVDGNQDNVCRVGFLLSPSTEHCFPADGTVLIESNDNDSYYEYEYMPLDDNLSDRTIQSFSTDTYLHHVLGQESNPLHTSMAMFQVYYGVTDYADRIVEAALTKGDAGLERGNMDFSDLSEEDFAGAEAAMEGTVILHMFMMVLRELEHSLDLCVADLNDGDDYSVGNDPVHALDTAVAYYTGSLQGNVVNDSTSGHLLHYVAELFCVNFNTCDDGQSRINRDLFSNFDILQEIYEAGDDCSDAELIVDEALTKQLYVPLVQGTLFFAFEQSVGDTSPKRNAEGAMFAASVLPVVHACNEDDAETIYQNMHLGKTSPTDFGAVKRALARNYDCMGLNCFDIGGVYIDGEYAPGAEPCSDADIEESESAPTTPNVSTNDSSSSSSDESAMTSSSSDDVDVQGEARLFPFDLVVAAGLIALIIGCVGFSIRWCCYRRCGRRAADATKDGIIVEKSEDEVEFEEVDLQAANHILT